MLKVGITGGIGSGKSTVSGVFELLGIPVFYTDDEAKKMMNEDVNLKQIILEYFGENAYKDGKLNRKYISSIVFNNPDKLKLLNSIVHPLTIAAADKWMQQQTTPYCIKEAALIFESDAQKNLDKVIGVFAPELLRIQRVMARDHISGESVKSRIDKQMDENNKMQLCDYIIRNDEQELVIPQVIKVHNFLLKAAK